jgi:hypothetical protein
VKRDVERERGPIVTAKLETARTRRAAVALSAPSRRPAEVARSLALAHQLRRLLDDSDVPSVSELAVRLGVTQPRITQLVNLTYLAPAAQDEIIRLEAVNGVEPASERALRDVLREVGWVAQGRRWSAVRDARRGRGGR